MTRPPSRNVTTLSLLPPYPTLATLLAMTSLPSVRYDSLSHRSLCCSLVPLFAAPAIQIDDGLALGGIVLQVCRRVGIQSNSEEYSLVGDSPRLHPYSRPHPPSSTLFASLCPSNTNPALHAPMRATQFLHILRHICCLIH